MEPAPQMIMPHVKASQPTRSTDRERYREARAEVPQFGSECRKLDLLGGAGGILDLIDEIVIVRWLRRFRVPTILRGIGNAHGPVIGNHRGLLFDVVIIEIV